MKLHWDGPTISMMDMLWTIAIIFMALVILVVPQPKVNPNAADRSICSLAVDITWPDGNNADVDLWVQAPGDQPVGYASPKGLYFDLVRDDLGSINDATSSNFERACSRGIPDGEYTVNVDLFSSNNEKGPVAVHVSVGSVDLSSAIMVELLSKDVSLDHKGEITVFRFTLHDGKLVQGSVNVIPKPLKMKRPGFTG